MAKKSRSGRGRGTRKRKRSYGWLYIVLGLVAMVGLIAGLSIISAGKAIGESFPTLPAIHIQPGESHEPYNTDPPTSGSHFASPAPSGFYETAIQDETLVHNLEHGYVVVWYNCAELSADDCTQLKEDVRQVYDTGNNSFKVVVVPRDGMEGLIALTSWGRMDRLDEFDGERMAEFISSNRDRGAPEAGTP